MRTYKPAIWRGLLIGLLLVLISLPGLFALHRILGLGNPPATGLILLGGTVALSLAAANMAGIYMGQSRKSPALAALLGLAIGIGACCIAAPFYGGIVMDGLTNDAMGMAWKERDKIIAGAQGAITSDTASKTFSAVREGRLREELSRLQEQASNATSPQTRQSAAAQAKIVAAQLAPRGMELLKLSAARSSAFALLLWALLAPPIGAAFECRKAQR